MSWFGKKKPNPEDGDFPHVPKHYREETTLTRAIKSAPPVQWSGETTVIWGIDIGAQVTTVSFAYLEAGHEVEVHNITYWPKAFPLRESASSSGPLPEIKSSKTFKQRETYESFGFVSHSTWPSDKTANYVHVVSAANSPPAFQIRTELPFIETPERHKFVDLVEHLLKHALAVYGAVIKKTQTHWSRASNIVISLPSAIPKSAEMTIVGDLNRMIDNTMPKVIGFTRVFYVPRPELRLFEDGSWRNLDTNLRHNDTIMIVDWDLTAGDMVCASYKVKQLTDGQIIFGTRLRSHMQASPTIGKRDSSTDNREGARFANALHWCAENKHCTQKLMIRTSNPFKKSDNLLTVFHKSLVEKGLQVGIRPIDQATETGAYGAVLWRIAHTLASNQSTNGEELNLVPDMTTLMIEEVNATALEPAPRSDPETLSKMSRIISTFQTGILGRVGKEKEAFGSVSPIDQSTPTSKLPAPSTSMSPLTSPTQLPPSGPIPPTSDQIHTAQTVDNTSDHSNVGYPLAEGTTEPLVPPPAYTNSTNGASRTAEKSGA